jgi:hypothetical protein
MYKRTAGLILTGVLATGAVGAVALTPASASTSDNAVTSRLAGIKTALSGLVSDGTLTQSQADKVASTLDTKLPKGPKGDHEGFGRPGGHFGRMGMGRTEDAAAKALGLTTAKLHTALESGKSLADVAKAQKVSVSSLVKAMVTATEGELTAAVKGGTMTQAQADKMTNGLTARITERVNNVRPERGPGHGPRGSAGSSPSGDAPSGTTATPSSTT